MSAPSKKPNVDFSKLKNLLLPKFDEQSIFLMGVSIVALLCVNEELSYEVKAIFLESGGPEKGNHVIVWPILGAIGILLATYHVFSKSEKSKFEIHLMLFFGVIVSFVAGFQAGVHMLEESRGWFLIFPIWNLICAGTVFWAFSDPNTVEAYFCTRDTTLIQLCIGILLTGFCLWYFSQIAIWHWSEVFSVCVFYSETADFFIRKVIGKAESA